MDQRVTQTTEIAVHTVLARASLGDDARLGKAASLSMLSEFLPCLPRGASSYPSTREV